MRAQSGLRKRSSAMSEERFYHVVIHLITILARITLYCHLGVVSIIVKHVLRKTDTLLGEATVKIIWAPSCKGVYSKSKDFAPHGS